MSMRLHWLENLSRGKHCQHCADAGMVVLDQFGPDPHGELTVEQAVPCPVCEAGGVASARWPGLPDGKAGLWSLDGWRRGLPGYSWNGGMRMVAR